MNWKKVGVWLSAIMVYAQSKYPGLDGQMIIDSMIAGTFWYEAASCAVSFFLVQSTNWLPIDLKDEVEE